MSKHGESVKRFVVERYLGGDESYKSAGLRTCPDLVERLSLCDGNSSLE